MPKDTLRNVAILTGSQAINNCGWGSVIPVLPIFATEFGLGPSGVGLILTTTALARFVCNIPFARMSDSFGRKPLMVAGQIMTAVASIGTGFCVNLPTLLACRLLLGTGSSCSTTGAQAYMADITSDYPSYRAKIMGFQATLSNVAYGLGPAIGGWLVREINRS